MNAAFTSLQPGRHRLLLILASIGAMLFSASVLARRQMFMPHLHAKNLQLNIRRRSVHKLQAIIVLAVAIALNGCRNEAVTSNGRYVKGDANARPYHTTFSLTENPISENGSWIGGGSAGMTLASLWARGRIWRGGRLWGDVQSAAGLAYGVSEPTEFGDPTAVLTGAWGPAQTVAATIRIKKTPTGRCCHEVELRLRTTISPKNITGYEAYCSVMANNQYCHIARWNGPNGSYWNFETGSVATYVKDGDTMKATVTGTNPTVITLYKNRVQVLKAIDTGSAGGGFGAYGPWTSGGPGIGFYDNVDKNWKDFGFSSFVATDQSESKSLAGTW